MAIEAIAQTAASYQTLTDTAAVKQNTAPAEKTTASDYTEVVVERGLAGNEGAADSAKKPAKRDGEESVNEQKPTNAQIKKAVEKLNKKMSNSEAIFGIHEETRRVTIKIVDKDSRKVLREYPPEETLDMIAKVWELAGIMVDEKK